MNDLPAFSFPGCYPLFYLIDHLIYCPECAGKNGGTTEQAHINYEAVFCCDSCSEIITSAYGE